MAADERHPFENNDLASGMAHAFDKSRPYFVYIVTLVAVVLVVWMGVDYYSQQRADAEAAAWDDFFRAETAGEFGQFVEAYPNTTATPYARLKQADYLFQDGKMKLLRDRSAGQDMLKESLEIYQELSSNQETPVIVAQQAAYGIGLVEETTGSLRKAKEAYDAVVKRFPGSEFSLMAERRAEALATPDTEKFYLAWASYEPPATDASGLPPLGPPPPSPSDAKDADDDEIPLPPESMKKDAAKTEEATPDAEKESTPKEVEPAKPDAPAVPGESKEGDAAPTPAADETKKEGAGEELPKAETPTEVPKSP